MDNDIREKLEKFEKELLGDSIREMFFQINNETEDRFLEMKEKLFSSKTNELDDLFIETLLVNEDEIFKFNSAFYPVVKDEKNIFDFEDLDIYLEAVYIDLPYYQLSDIEEIKFDGWLNINGESYNIKIIFEQDKRYIEKIKRLYNAFELNGQKWNTINMIHIKRMYRIKIVEYDFDMTDKIYNNFIKNKNNIEYSFGFYEENIIRRKKLLWNVEEKSIISTMFVRPTKTDISFEYILKFRNGEKILVENTEKTDILCCHIENENELNIISRRDDESLWNVFSIKSIDKCRKSIEMNLKDVLPYTHFTNLKKISFIDKIRKQHNNENNIRSRAYLEKKFSEYDFIKNSLKLKDISINKEVDENISLYDCNDFIKTDFDIFWKKEKIKLNLFVECIKRDKYTEDIISFVISEIQKNIPEYDCRGYLYE